MSLAGPSWRAVLKNSKLSETRSKKTSGIFLTQSLLVLNPFAGWELSDILRFLKTRHYYHRLTKSWAFKVLLFSRKLFRFSETFIKQTIVQPHKSQAGQISSRLQAEPTRNAAPSEVVGGKGRGGRTQEDHRGRSPGGRTAREAFVLASFSASTEIAPPTARVEKTSGVSDYKKLETRL